MKINILTGPFCCIPPYSIGAVEKLWYLLGECWKSEGHEVCFISRKPEQTPKDCNIYIKGYDRTGSWLKDLVLDLVYSYRALSKAPESDAIVLNSIWSPVLYRLFKRKFSYSLYNVARFPKNQMSLYDNMNCLACVSTAVYNALVEQSPRMKNKACVIPNPIDTEIFRSQYVHEFSSEPMIVYTGRVHREKGLELLVKAVACLNEKYHVKLRIIGASEIEKGGSGKDYVEELNKLACNFNIEWIAPIYNPKELAATIREGNIFCYPSLAEKGETFGVSPLEGMGLWLVPIVSDLDCFKDFVNKQNGFVFERKSDSAIKQITDYVVQLIESRMLYEQKSVKAIETAKQFSVQNVAEMYMNKFKEQ